MILSQIQKTESTHYIYTFNIKKEGAPEDALLENLSPLADGNKKNWTEIITNVTGKDQYKMGKRN